jgi:hypothetical protein
MLLALDGDAWMRVWTFWLSVTCYLEGITKMQGLEAYLFTSHCLSDRKQPSLANDATVFSYSVVVRYGAVSRFRSKLTHEK